MKGPHLSHYYKGPLYHYTYHELCTKDEKVINKRNCAAHSWILNAEITSQTLKIIKILWYCIFLVISKHCSWLSNKMMFSITFSIRRIPVADRWYFKRQRVFWELHHLSWMQKNMTMILFWSIFISSIRAEQRAADGGIDNFLSAAGSSMRRRSAHSSIFHWEIHMAKRAKAQSSELLWCRDALRVESSVLMTSNIVFPSSIFFWVAWIGGGLQLQ